MPTLDEQVAWWTRQADHDMATARLNRGGGAHDACALMCQQAAEKYLKALTIKTTATTPPRTHQCERLAQMLAAPPHILDAARLLESDYMESRYPDAAQGVPFEMFTDADSADHLSAAEVIEQWVLQQLRPTP